MTLVLTASLPCFVRFFYTLFCLLQEIVLVLSDLCRGPADKKLRWAFHIYDIDGDGVISRSELEEVALSINELTGEPSNPVGDPLVASSSTCSSVRLWVDRIFQVHNTNIVTHDVCTLHNPFALWHSFHSNFAAFLLATSFTVLYVA